MKSKIVIYLSRPPSGGIGMRIAGTTPEEFADILGCFKSCIPADARTYDRDQKLWVIDSTWYVDFRGFCASVMRRHGGRVSDEWCGVRTSPTTPPPYPDVTVELALRDLHLLPGALDHPQLLAIVFEYLRTERCQAGDEAGESVVIEAYETLTHTLQRAA